jgi:hypothetical protein
MAHHVEQASMTAIVKENRGVFGKPILRPFHPLVAKIEPRSPFKGWPAGSHGEACCPV